MNQYPWVVCLMGPTASGKTDAAFSLCDQFPFDIISVDAVQVYRGMDIGAAKPCNRELLKYPHRLIDIREPGEIYSAADFCANVDKEIKDICAHGRIPLLVGGTMFYFHALEHGLSPYPSANEGIRNQIEQRAFEQGWDEIHNELRRVDPKTAARIKPSDKQRLQRAMEIFMLTEEAPSVFAKRENKNKLPIRLIKIALNSNDRDGLYKKIAKRFIDMLEQGLIDEVSALRESGALRTEHSAARTVGYRQVTQFLEGELDYDAMVDSAIAATRQLAKRQLTWLRRNRGCVWFDTNSATVFQILEQYLQHKFSLIGL